jgi:hypothetical protein
MLRQLSHAASRIIHVSPVWIPFWTVTLRVTDLKAFVELAEHLFFTLGLDGRQGEMGSKLPSLRGEPPHSHWYAVGLLIRSQHDKGLWFLGPRPYRPTFLQGVLSNGWGSYSPSDRWPNAKYINGTDLPAAPSCVSNRHDHNSKRFFMPFFSSRPNKCWKFVA